MDPLSLIVQELRRAEENAAMCENYLSRFEARRGFDASDEVYRRLADEKQIVLRSAAELRSKLTNQGDTNNLIFRFSCKFSFQRSTVVKFPNPFLQRSTLFLLRDKQSIEWRVVSFLICKIIPC